jgi:hypothetical protein
LLFDKKTKDLSQMSLSELEAYRQDLKQREEEDEQLDTTTHIIADPIL